MPGNTPAPEAQSSSVQGGFNEAPAKCRGIQPQSFCLKRARTRFNEAPAKCRGIRRERAAEVRRQLRASMRPQRNAGEYIAPLLLEAGADVLQ